MSLDSIRTSVATAVSQAVATFTDFNLVVEYDNRIIVDTQTQTLPFLTVETKLLDGFQVDLTDRPIHRILGQIHLAVAVPEGTGRVQANKVLDHLYPKLQRKKLGVINTRMAVPAPERPHNGWIYYPVLIPFWSDQLT